MAEVIAMYKRPADPAAFDRYYYATHVPIAKRIRGLRHYEVTTGPITTPEGMAPYHLIAILEFDAMADIEAALASPEGQATVADLANFAAAGVDIYFADTRAI